jgi:hypothetical protein
MKAEKKKDIQTNLRDVEKNLESSTKLKYN